jgi:hypothetical protein
MSRTKAAENTNLKFSSIFHAKPSGSCEPLKNVVQVCAVVKDLQSAMERYWSLGIGPWNIYTLAPPLLRETTMHGKPAKYSHKVAVTMIGNTQFELIQPLEGPTTYRTFLERRGEGLHHIKEKVDDIPATIAEFKKKGIEVIQSGKIDEDEFYYLDTESTLGFYYELGNMGWVRAPEARYPPEEKK